MRRFEWVRILKPLKIQGHRNLGEVQRSEEKQTEMQQNIMYICYFKNERNITKGDKIEGMGEKIISCEQNKSRWYFGLSSDSSSRPLLFSLNA